MESVFEEGGDYRGPSVVAVGWIPYISLCRPMPEAFKRHKRWCVFRGMFLTGNDPPPASFADENHFNDFVRTKEYRAILGVSNVLAGFDAGGISVSSPHDDQFIGGYTPLGIRIGTRNVNATFRWHSHGEETHASSIAIGMDHAPIGKSIQFRVAKRMNWGFKLFTGHYLPYAAMDFSYTIDANGDCEVSFGSTCIPNLTVYKDWRAIGHYHLCDITAEELEDFVTADTRCELPRRRERYTFRDRLSRIA